jgi:hypothetical protein
MPADESINKILTELAAIAKAPMTPEQREQRSRGLVSGEVGVEALAQATARADLAWSLEMARIHNVDVATWLEAVGAVGLAGSDSLGSLLARLHATESAADLLRSGYKPERGPLGELKWSRP